MSIGIGILVGLWLIVGVASRSHETRSIVPLPTLGALPTEQTVAPTPLVAAPIASNPNANSAPIIGQASQNDQTTTNPAAESVSPVDTLTLIPPAEPVDGQVIVRFAPDTDEPRRLAYVQSIGGLMSELIAPLNAMVVSLPAGTDPDSLPLASGVVGIEHDYVAVATGVAVSEPLLADQWALPVIGAPDAWAALPDNPPALTIAVIDSGVCQTHPDLQGHLLTGWDFVENDPIPQDDLGHGCGVTGVIAADIFNKIGIAGIVPNARILPLRVLDAQGMGTYSNVAAAIVYATDNGANIINLSMGGIQPSSLLLDAVNYAAGQGVPVIAAAGNTGQDSILFPAAYDSVIAVGAIDPDLKTSVFSSVSPQIDLYAPGRDILTTAGDDRYALMTGTSLAASHVTGVAALELALGLNLTLSGGIVTTHVAPDNTQETTDTTVSNPPAGSDSPVAPVLNPAPGQQDTSTGQITNSGSASTFAETAPDLALPENGASLTEAQPSFAWSSVNGATQYEFYLDANNPPTTRLSSSPLNLFKPEDALTNGMYYWRVRGVDASGQFSAWSQTFQLQIAAGSASNELAAPGLLLPADGTETSSQNPVFVWEARDYAQTYQLQIATDAAFSAVMTDKTQPSQLYIALSLTPGTYYWRVRGITKDGQNSAWSSSRSLIIHASAPSLPTTGPILTLPANSSVVQIDTPTLQWQPVTNATRYEVQLGTANPPTTTAGQVSATSYTSSAPLPPGTYYWRVRAADDTGHTTNWSSVFAFTRPAPLGAPQLLSPSNGQKSQNRQPTFNWQPVSGATQYEIQLDNANPPTTTVASGNIVSFAPSAPLPYDTYYWRVRALNDSGIASSWSQTFTLTIAAPAPPTPPPTEETTPEVTAEPTQEPPAPTEEATAEVTQEPTQETAPPTEEVTPEVTAEATQETVMPTEEVTLEVTAEPTQETVTPTEEVTPEVTQETATPTEEVTAEVTQEPVVQQAAPPTQEPTQETITPPPTDPPTAEPPQDTTTPTDSTPEVTAEWASS